MAYLNEDVIPVMVHCARVRIDHLLMLFIYIHSSSFGEKRNHVKESNFNIVTYW